MSSRILIDGEVVHASPKVVLFDKDGTLIDIHHYWASMIHLRSERIVQHWFPTATDQLNIKNTLVDAMGVDLQTGRMKPNGPVGIKPRPFIVAVAADIVRSKGGDVSDDDMESLFAEVDQVTSADMLPLLKVLPGVEELLKKLQQCGIQSVVVSTDITSRARKAMEVLQLNQYFSEIIGGDLVENTKPAPELAELALERVNCKAVSAVVIGDHPVDIQMGHSAAINTNIGVLTGLSVSTAFTGQNCHVVSDLESIKVICSDVK